MLSLKTFLEKYSTIDKYFLNEFLTFYSEKTIDTDIVIDFSNISKWLNIKKKSLKKTLIKTYNLGSDYTIEKIKRGKGSGSGPPIYKILVTPRCFKKICMMTRSKNGEKVRNYYLELELIVNKYKNYIIQFMSKRTQTLENNQKPKINAKSGCIYIIKASNKDYDNLYKIGKTKNLRNRLNVYNSGNADDIDVLYHYDVSDDIDKLEKCIKIQIKKYQYRKYKEVYQTDINIIKNVIDHCDKFKLLLKGGDMQDISGNVYMIIIKDELY